MQAPKKCHEDAIPQHHDIAAKRAANGFHFGPGLELGPGLGQNAPDEHRCDQADNGVGKEQRQVGMGGQQPADGRADRRRQIESDPDDPVALGALALGEHVSHHGLPGRAAGVGDDT